MFQTPRKEIKIRCAAEYFWRTLRCLKCGQAVLSVWCIFSIEIKTEDIVNRGEWLWNSSKFFVVCFCSVSWPWPCTKHNSCLLRTEELTSRNVLVTGFMHSVWGQNKRLCRVVDFQHKSWHLSLLLWCLPGFITIPLYHLCWGENGEIKA